MELRYTAAQKTAVNHRRGNLLILACAGSGKTEVISRRIAELVREKVKKSAIIAFTFTERAANELKARIRKHLEDLVPDDPSLGDMYVGTIHSFCLQLLKEIDPNNRKFEVMDEARQVALIMTNFNYFPDSGKGIGLDRLRSRSKTGGFFDAVRTFATTLSVIHQKQIPIKKIRDKDLRFSIDQYNKTAYDSPNYFLDFDYIISKLIDTLKNKPQELEQVQKRFEYLVVDEYQDVDDRQEELIRLISGNGRKVYVTAVGDDDQAIYGWRGARIRNILTYQERYPNVKEIKLVYNFRSTHAIVEIANRAIRILSPESRTEKEMEARHWEESSSSKLGFVETLAEKGDVQKRVFDSDIAEANWVAERAVELRGTLIKEKDGRERAIDYADMAVLLRSVKSSGKTFASVLQEKSIPVVVKGIGGLFDHDEVLLINAAFCLLARTPFIFENDSGPNRLEESENRDFIRTKIEKLRKRGAMPKAQNGPFLEWIAAKREELDRRSLEKDRRERLARRIYPQDIFQEMLEKLGSADGPDPWPQDILFNLGRLSGLIAQFEAVHQWVTPNNLVSLCMFLGGWAAGQVDEGGLDETGSPNAVQIMTVHAAKGLEWPVVFIPRVSSANFPSSLRNRGPNTFLDKTLFDPKEYAGGDEGERRLWYVGITRCQKFLNITSQARPRKKPSEYFREIQHERVQKSGPTPKKLKGVPSPPANVELLPTTYSDLNYFWRCPFEYQLRALMGFGPGVRESYGYGQQIHNILAEVHKKALNGKYLKKEEVEKLVEKRFHLRYTRDGEKYKPLTTLRDAAKMALIRYMERYPDSGRFVLDAEKPFEFVDKESGALISGTIDLLQRIDTDRTGEPVKTPVAVIDFKTHRWEDEVGFFRKKEEVEAQLRLYAVAVRKALGFEAHKARAHFLSPKPIPKELELKGVRELIDVDVSMKKQKELRIQVQNAVKGITESIRTKKFELKGCDTGHCPDCDFWKICPGYRIWDKFDRTTPRPTSPENSREKEMLRVIEDLDAR